MPHGSDDPTTEGTSSTARATGAGGENGTMTSAGRPATGQRTLVGVVFAELHGGTVAKAIGDAVMVVVGVPLLHDDVARAERIAALRQEIARAVVPMSR